MSIVRQEAWDQYGGSLDRALETNLGWAEFRRSSLIQGDARTGSYFLRTGNGNEAVGLNGARLVLPDAMPELFVHFGYRLPSLPLGDSNTRALTALNGELADIVRIDVKSNGGLIVRDSAGASLGETGALAINPGAWEHIAVHMVFDGAEGSVEIRVNKETVLTLTGLSIGSTGPTALQFARGVESAGLGPDQEIDDIVVNSPDGDRNNTWLGDPRVVVLNVRADYLPEQGWTPQPRYKFGNGVLQLDGNGDAITCADSSDFEFGSGDFTMEMFVKFIALPTGSNRAVLFSKWRDGTNERAYQLYLGGPTLNNGQIAFRVSTDGTAATEAQLFSVAWEPSLGHYYHVAIQRDGGETTLYIDGRRMHAPVADANSYHDNTSLFSIGGQQNGASSILANTSINGFVEEVRVTKGVARYNAGGFDPPTAAFERGVGDPDWASTVLLAGFDAGIVDESAFVRAITARGNAARFAVDDIPPGAYKTINQPGRDDTFIEAPYTAATAVLTFTDQPADTETVTVDDVTYTFEAAFSDTAGKVLIGATLEDTIDNLVAAINGEAGEGTAYGTGTTASDEVFATNIANGQMRVEASTAGSAGNAIDVASTAANAVWSGSTLEGGDDIPDPSSFTLDRLPPRTTGVRAITLVTRARKTDSGDCKIQAAFITADGSSANGDDRPLTTNFVYYGDIIEEDPSTEGALTPSSFIGSRVRVDRTL